MMSLTLHIDTSRPKHYLRLYFFEEYEIPLHGVTEYVENDTRGFVRDRAEFEACGSKFVVRKRKDSGDTIVEVTSESHFPPAFDLRIQEALQYITGKTAAWRARLEALDEELQLELSSPPRRSSRTQFNPPISPISIDSLHYGWRLFGKYLAYVAATTHGTYWNPVAYHLYNACQATAGSIDAWAVGVSVAVEAIAGLIDLEEEEEKAKLLAEIQGRMREWLEDQSGLPSDLVSRVRGQINAITNKRPQDILYALAKTGNVEKDYVKAWSYLRNKHVHPTLKDLKKPDEIDYQKLIDHVHRVEVLLRQLTFYLIGYEGPFTDYGVHGDEVFPIKQYPLKDPASS
jgi:hypothetical protein